VKFTRHGVSSNFVARSGEVRAWSLVAIALDCVLEAEARAFALRRASTQTCVAGRDIARRRSIRSESSFHFSSFPGGARPRFTLARKKVGSVKRRLWTFFESRRGNERVQKPHPLLTQRMGQLKSQTRKPGPLARKSLFLWFFDWGCWMPDGVLPTAARETYCLVMFPLQLEGEVLLAQSGEIQD